VQLPVHLRAERVLMCWRRRRTFETH
jgi:hypothetical protein